LLLARVRQVRPGGIPSRYAHFKAVKRRAKLLGEFDQSWIRDCVIRNGGGFETGF